ncbi:hypothetical protein JAAARDRAFT_192858 [Jaapia argillacea MUCL 33604]|uniref:CCHC-type domain-containing protein n=1 Tax=Jaapia argillacea MUCL 33604 TaxID=933084 RepID=A0A067PX95_9AGAM|nr:hypothetical protein JAAARDRAFT_192858 [Jaapia argillacea MUCL 33604]
MIQEKMGFRLTEVPQLKNLKVPAPELYNGQDDIDIFEEWLQKLLRWLCLYRITGPELDYERLQILGQYVKGLAADWYNQEVDAPYRRVRAWSFESAIVGLHRRFLHKATAQHAVDKFYACKFSCSDGVASYYNNLLKHASRMVERPDDYTLRRKFLCGLPTNIAELLLHSRNISAEHSPVELILEEAIQMESSNRFLWSYQHQSTEETVNRSSRPEVSQNSTSNAVKHNSGSNSGAHKVIKVVRFCGNQRPSGSRFFDSVCQDTPGQNRDQPRPSFAAKPDEKKPAASGNSKGVTCFKCGCTGRYANDCQSSGSKPTEQMYAAQRVEDEVIISPDNKAPHHSENGLEAVLGDDMADPPLEEYDDEFVGGSQYDPDDVQASDVYYEYEYEEPAHPSDDMDASSVEYMHMMHVMDNAPSDIAFQFAMKDAEIEPGPSRSRMIKATGKGSRPTKTQQSKDCRTAYVDIGGSKAFGLFDTGSTTDSISPEFAHVARLKVFELENPASLQLRCVGS